MAQENATETDDKGAGVDVWILCEITEITKNNHYAYVYIIYIYLIYLIYIYVYICIYIYINIHSYLQIRQIVSKSPKVC